VPAASCFPGVKRKLPQFSLSADTWVTCTALSRAVWPATATSAPCWLAGSRAIGADHVLDVFPRGQQAHHQGRLPRQARHGGLLLSQLHLLAGYPGLPPGDAGLPLGGATLHGFRALGRLRLIA
jgi:hypothetical protein